MLEKVLFRVRLNRNLDKLSQNSINLVTQFGRIRKTFDTLRGMYPSFSQF